MLGGNSCISHL